MTDAIFLERIKSEYLGKKEEVETMMTLFDKHNKDIAKQVGISVSAATFQNIMSANDTSRLSCRISTNVRIYACLNSPISSYTILIFSFAQ